MPVEEIRDGQKQQQQTNKKTFFVHTTMHPQTAMSPAPELHVSEKVADARTSPSFLEKKKKRKNETNEYHK